MTHRLLLLIGSLTLMALTIPSSASACSPLHCKAPRLLAGENITVPVNAPALLVMDAVDRLTGEPNPAEVLLFDMSGSTGVPLEVAIEEGRLVPAMPLVEGAIYELVISFVCNDDEYSSLSTITVGPPAELPTQLGTLPSTSSSVLGSVPLPADAMCLVQADAAFVDIAVELGPEMQPWADLLVYETYVDGVRYQPRATYPDEPRSGERDLVGYHADPAGSWRGRGQDRIYALCGSLPEDASHGEGVEEGTHMVTFRASLSGTDISLETEAAPITLHCVHPERTDDPSFSTGCSVGGSRSGWGSTALALLGLGMFWRRRRL